MCKLASLISINHLRKQQQLLLVGGKLKEPQAEHLFFTVQHSKLLPEGKLNYGWGYVNSCQSHIAVPGIKAINQQCKANSIFNLHIYKEGNQLILMFKSSVSALFFVTVFRKLLSWEKSVLAIVEVMLSYK